VAPRWRPPRGTDGLTPIGPPPEVSTSNPIEEGKKTMRGTLKMNVRFLGGWCICAVAGCGWLTTPTKSTIWHSDIKALKKAEDDALQLCKKIRGDFPESLPPHKFTTDGCSMWPDGSWQQCCVEHDMPYWCGGSAEDRKNADRHLSECVAKKASWLMGSLMYVGVRFGGMPWWPTRWRWGYGWDWPHGYEQLQLKEKVN